MNEYSAGAVVYTKKDNEVYYLLIKDFHGNWGFPKGHLEGDESFKDAALREIKEEVGIDVDIHSTFKSELVYMMPNGHKKHSLYYIGEYSNQEIVIQPDEVQETMLLKYNEALEALTFKNMKKVLVEADLYIKNQK